MASAISTDEATNVTEEERQAAHARLVDHVKANGGDAMLRQVGETGSRSLTSQPDERTGKMAKFAMYSIQGDGNRADVELEATTLEEAMTEAREWHESIHLIDGEPYEVTVTVVELNEEGDEVRYHGLTVTVGSRPA